MSEIFLSYEREYCELSAGITRKVSAAASLGRDSRRQKLEEVDDDIGEADALIRRMDLEARSLPPAERQPLLSKLREYKSDLSNLKRDSQKAAQAANGADAARNELLGDAEDPYGSGAASQRERLLNTTQRLDRTSERLRAGKQQLMETEELGIDIMNNLHSQRETLVRARDTLHGADDNISASRKVLSSMARRFFQNKLILWGIILMLVAAILLVLYFKVFKGKK